MDKKLNFLFGLLGMLTIGIAILGYQTLPHSVLIGLAMLGMACAVAHGYFTVSGSSTSKRVGYGFFVIWSIVAATAMTWGSHYGESRRAASLDLSLR